MVIQLLKRLDFASCDNLESKSVANALHLHAQVENLFDRYPIYNIYFPQGTMLDSSDLDYYFGKEYNFVERFKRLIAEGNAVLVEE